MMNALFRFDYDQERHRLVNETTLSLTIASGLPDGSTRDAAGRIYNCRVAGGQEIAVLSADLTSLNSIRLPCRSPTSCIFGGPKLSTLYVTSARFGMSEIDIERSPHEGSVMAIELPVVGKAPNFFG